MPAIYLSCLSQPSRLNKERAGHWQFGQRMHSRAPFLVAFLFISAPFGLSAATDACQANRNNNANTIIVDQSGKGDFVKVQEAVDSVRSGNDQWTRIHVNPGIYKEQVEIPMGKPCILLEGSGLTQTIITGDGHAQTNSSATFTVSLNNFVAKRIAFKNSYNRGAVVHSITEWEPAVAATVYGDKMAFHECAFLGFQDTLWDVQGRHYFNSCYIEGAVDFIWGSGQSVFEDCAINVTAGLLPKGVLAGFITAQGRQSATDPSGFVFIRGTVSGIGKAFLGRAYGPFSRVIYHGTTLEAVVAPAGWNAWKYQNHVNNLLYVEVDCGGPGADKSKRVAWETKSLGYSELRAFSRERFIDQDGWIGNQPE